MQRFDRTRARSWFCFLSVCLAILPAVANEVRPVNLEQMTERLLGSVEVTPRVIADPAQPPQGLSSEEWSKIQRQLRASRYDLVQRAGDDVDKAVWVATHPGLSLEFEFDARGMSVQPRGAQQRDWHWGLQLVSFGAEGSLQSAGPASPHVEGNRVEYRRPGLTEWYVHDSRGVEQGFTVESSPKGDPDRMRIEMALSGTLVASLTSAGEGLALRDAAEATALRYDKLHAFDAAGRDLPAWMELRENGESAPHLALWVDIREAEFPVVVDPLISTQVAKLTASDAAASDFFGEAVSISGDTVVVGAARDDDAGAESGSAYVYERNTGGVDNWGQVAKLTASDAAAGAEYGASVSISGDTVDCSGVRNLAKEADLLLQCCYLAEAEIDNADKRVLSDHVLGSAVQANRIAKAANVKKMVLTHLAPKTDSMLAAVLAEAKEGFVGEVVLGSDLMSFEI